MHTCYEVVLRAEDGEYTQETFQTEQAAYAYIVENCDLYDEGQELYIKPIYRSF